MKPKVTACSLQRILGSRSRSRPSTAIRRPSNASRFPRSWRLSKPLSSDSRRHRGYGAVGVAINSAPTEGVRVTPLSQLKSTFPVLKNPANRHRAVPFTYEQWRYVFTNTFDEADARAAYDRYHVPASGGIFWDSVLANFIPGPQDIAVDYHNDARPPLLFISGGEDHLMPPAIQRSNLKHYKSNTITEIKEFAGRSHLMPAQKGWEEVADFALAWAVEHATRQPQVSRSLGYSAVQPTSSQLEQSP